MIVYVVKLFELRTRGYGTLCWAKYVGSAHSFMLYPMEMFMLYPMELFMLYPMKLFMLYPMKCCTSNFADSQGSFVSWPGMV